MQTLARAERAMNHTIRFVDMEFFWVHMWRVWMKWINESSDEIFGWQGPAGWVDWSFFRRFTKGGGFWASE